MKSKKVVVITGGNSGIGLALVKEYAGKGHNVAFSGRNVERIKEVEEDCKELAGQVFGMKADVQSEQEVSDFKKRVLESYGRVDILINNAGISMRALFKDLDLKVFKELIDINLMGAVVCTRLFLEELIKTRGSIVGISSIAGYRGLPGRSAYSASKFALQGFLESLRTELLKTGVHVLIACPGFTASNIRKSSRLADGSQQGESPLEEGKIMSAEEVASRIYKAIEKRKKILTLTSQGRMTVFMNKLFPSWMDGQVYAHFKKEKDSPL